MPLVHRFNPPERFVAGTVGEPGQRTFFLQARAGARVTSVALEKEQVSVLAERIDELLDEVLRSSGGDSSVPAVAPLELEDDRPLDQPIEEEFRAGTMTLAWDPVATRVVVEVFPVDSVIAVELEADDAEEEEEDPALDPTRTAEGGEEGAVAEVSADEVLEVHLEPAVARAFVKRALAVISAGRPPCPFCGSPLDPEGHVCPRANGFKRLSQ